MEKLRELQGWALEILLKEGQFPVLVEQSQLPELERGQDVADVLTAALALCLVSFLYPTSTLQLSQVHAQVQAIRDLMETDLASFLTSALLHAEIAKQSSDRGLSLLARATQAAGQHQEQQYPLQEIQRVERIPAYTAPLASAQQHVALQGVSQGMVVGLEMQFSTDDLMTELLKRCLALKSVVASVLLEVLLAELIADPSQLKGLSVRQLLDLFFERHPIPHSCAESILKKVKPEEIEAYEAVRPRYSSVTYSGNPLPQEQARQLPEPSARGMTRMTKRRVKFITEE